MLALDDPGNIRINGEHASNRGKPDDQKDIVNILTYLS